MTDEEKKTTEATETPEKVEETPVVEEKAPEVETKTEEKQEEGKRERRPRRGGRDRAPREPKEFEEAILQIDRVTRVVAGGRRLRFRVSVVIGDGKGRVGFGIGKASEVMLGVQKAVAQAKRSLINVPIFDGTIPHEMTASFKSSHVLLFPAPEGKGVIAGGAVRKILELAGVRDVLSKVHGSRNKLNVARATIDALGMLQNKAPHGSKKQEEVKEKETPKKEDVEKKSAAKKPAKKATPKKTK